MSVSEALAELDRVAPHAPLLALGQTVFWDEPMKAGIALAAQALASKRRLVAGVHDTDYFAKLPSGARRNGEFRAFAHNDTTTRGLWTAAAEFSALFGSETVITREVLLSAGLRIEKVFKNRPNKLDEATEAWGWKGIVSLDDEAPVAADVSVKALFPELKSTLDWAVDTSLQSIADTQRLVSTERAEHLTRLVQKEYDEHESISLADLYRDLLPKLYSFVSGQPVEIESTKTTELLRLNVRTCAQPRFDLVNLFVSPDSAEAARDAYNEAIRGSEIYSLDRFGTGAIPFDLVIPGHGRGTLRIAPKAIVVMTREPQFVSLKRPIRHVQDLAAAISGKFGDDCALIGKAVSLIGMLAREFVFVFHEGASGYVKYTRKFHEELHSRGFGLKMNPILRVRLNVWDALRECQTWLRLPEPLRGPFGTEELTSLSFATRWREVGDEQTRLLDELGKLRRSLDLIKFLEARAGGSWHCLANEYDGLHQRLAELDKEVGALKEERRTCYRELRALKQNRVAAERKMGEHFRSNIFEKSPSESTLAVRDGLRQAVEVAIHRITAKKQQIRSLLQRQREFVGAPEIQILHERRRSIELEAELKRLRLIREAVIAGKGLAKASFRPSAWWFPVLCPDGGWFKAAIAGAECYLEPVGP